MKADKLAAALMRDRARTCAGPSNTSIECFGCGRPFIYRGPQQGDDNGRFCSDKCREAYDAGYRRAEPVDAFKPSTAMRRGPVGWHIACAGCQREFESKGLRHCSTECERRCRERQENAELMAEVGMQVEAKRKCAKPECNNPVPKWRKGRRVSKRARFCDRLSLLKTRSVRIDCAVRQGSDTQQYLRTVRSGVCGARPSRAKREFALRYNMWCTSLEFVEGARR
jgi:hypothetical protein